MSNTQICPTCGLADIPETSLVCPKCNTPLGQVLGYDSANLYPPPSLTVGGCLHRGWEGFKANPGVAIGGILIYLIIVGVAGSIPCVGPLFQLFVAPAFIAGLMLFSLNLSRRTHPSIGDLFAGFSHYGGALGLFWLFFVIYLVCYVPALIGVLVAVIMDSFHGEDAIKVAVLVPTIAASVVLLVMALLRWGFAWYFFMDNPASGVFDALQNSARATQGVRWQILGIGIVLMLVYLAGFIALCVGALVTMPLVLAASASMYDAIRERGKAVDRP